jgi:hypothetical protein
VSTRDWSEEKAAESDGVLPQVPMFHSFQQCVSAAKFLGLSYPGTFVQKHALSTDGCTTERIRCCYIPAVLIFFFHPVCDVSRVCSCCQTFGNAATSCSPSLCVVHGYFHGLRPSLTSTLCAASDGEAADSDEADADVIDDDLDGSAAPPPTADYWQRLLKENWLRLQKVLPVSLNRRQLPVIWRGASCMPVDNYFPRTPCLAACSRKRHADFVTSPLYSRRLILPGTTQLPHDPSTPRGVFYNMGEFGCAGRGGGPGASVGGAT